MKVTLKRTDHLEKATLGELFCEGYWPTSGRIFTLENPKRATDKDSLIPAGTYECKPYSSAKHPNVYEVLNVPNRTKILLHTGNSEKDTEGCILLGNRIGEIKGEPAVLDSRKAFERFRGLVGQNNFTLTIED